MRVNSRVVETHLQEKALKTIAKSLFKELRQHGYESRQIVSLSSELLHLVNADLREQAQPR